MLQLTSALCYTGVLFQYPGAVMSALAGVGASRVLKDPPAWLHALTAAGLPIPSSSPSPFLPLSTQKGESGELP